MGKGIPRRRFLQGAMLLSGTASQLPSRAYRLLIVNPNTTELITEQVVKNARQYARPGTKINGINPDEGPKIILGHYENDIATAAMLRKIESLDRSSYDAVIVAAYTDSGLYALRELLDVPVLGIAESSMLLGCILGHKFTILSFVERLRPFFEDLVKRYGFNERLASIRLIQLPADQLRDSAGRPHPRLIEGAKAALTNDGAEVILLGGSTLTGLEKYLEEEIRAPVIDGVVAAIKLAESLLDYGKRPSKVKAFRTPESKGR